MSTSERTMSQVRAILQRLDRSIDEARERRTQPAPAAAPVAPPPPAKAAAATPPRVGDGSSAAARPASPFGRAQPLNRGGSTYRWGN